MLSASQEMQILSFLGVASHAFDLPSDTVGINAQKQCKKCQPDGLFPGWQAEQLCVSEPFRIADHE